MRETCNRFQLELADDIDVNEFELIFEDINKFATITLDHSKLDGLNNPDQHPIKAIKGLQRELDKKVSKEDLEVLPDNELLMVNKTGELDSSKLKVTDVATKKYVDAKPGEKCEGKTFSVHTGELTDANILKFNSDGSFPSEQKTASADSERFNAYAERGVYQNAAIGECSTVFGSRSWVIGDGGFASGTCNLVKGLLGVAFGMGHYLYESSQKGFACGSNNRLFGKLEFVSGTGNSSNGYASHVEGAANRLSAKYAHAEGAYNENYGYACHVEGRGNIADGGRGSANGKPQHVEGQYNVQDGTQTYAHIVGNGTSKSDRSNAHTLNYNGTAWYANAVKVGGTSETDAKTLATEEFVTNAINAALYVDSQTEVG